MKAFVLCHAEKPTGNQTSNNELLHFNWLVLSGTPLKADARQNTSKPLDDNKTQEPTNTSNEYKEVNKGMVTTNELNMTIYVIKYHQGRRKLTNKSTQHDNRTTSKGFFSTNATVFVDVPENVDASPERLDKPQTQSTSKDIKNSWSWNQRTGTRWPSRNRWRSTRRWRRPNMRRPPSRGGQQGGGRPPSPTGGQGGRGVGAPPSTGPSPTSGGTSPQSKLYYQ